MLLSRDSENLKISHVLKILDYLQYLPTEFTAILKSVY